MKLKHVGSGVCTEYRDCPGCVPDDTPRLTPLEERIRVFRAQIPAFCDAGTPGAIRGLGEEFGELCEAMIVGTKEDVCSEAADMAFVLAGMLAAKGESLTAWLEKKVVRAEANVERIAATQAARQRGANP